MYQSLSKSVVLAVCATAALGVSAASGHQRARAGQLEGCPTHLDYVVLASLADSGNWVGLSSYRSEGTHRLAILAFRLCPESGL